MCEFRRQEETAKVKHVKRKKISKMRIMQLQYALFTYK
jgi:hypothetical protein